MTNKKLLILHVYFGQLPAWFNKFIESCSFNKQLNFLFVLTEHPNIQHSNNIRIIIFTVKEFENLVLTKFSQPIKLGAPYKLCDYKPLFGKLFEDYLSDYEYWAYCDNDLLLGDIKPLLDRLFINEPDIISFYRTYLSGPFCIYRNTPQINLIFQQSPYLSKVLGSSNYIGFDEHIKREFKKYKLIFWLWSLAIHLYTNFGLLFISFKEFRYQFQWVFKKVTNRANQLFDITDIVNYLKEKGEINVVFRELIWSDRKFNRLNKNNWRVEYSSGRLVDVETKQQIEIFHFVELKKRLKYIDKNILKNYFLDKDGFHAIKK